MHDRYVLASINTHTFARVGHTKPWSGLGCLYGRTFDMESRLFEISTFTAGLPMANTPSKDHKRRERELKKMYKRQAREEAKAAKKAAQELAAAEAVQKAAEEEQAKRDAEFEAAFAAELAAEAAAAKKEGE